MSESKRHHILPESFQKLFSSDGENKVWCAFQRKLFETNAVNVAVVSRHYEFYEDGKKEDWLEADLSSREGLAIPTIKKIIESRNLKSLTFHDRQVVTDFLKLCMMRFFEFSMFSEENESIDFEALRQAIKGYAAGKNSQLSDKILTDEFLKEAHHAAKKQAIISPIPKSSEELDSMRMFLVVAKENVKFISGEYVGAYFQGKSGNSAIMPICPDIAIRWSHRKSSPIQSVNDKWIRRANEQIFRMSTYSIASEKEELHRLIELDKSGSFNLS